MTKRADPVASGPIRMCVGCRARAAKSDLLRIVVVEDRLVPDPRATSPGRGASLHLDPDCLALAERRRAFPRALRVTGPLDAEPLRNYLAQEGCAPSNTAQPGTTQPDRQSGTT